MSYPAYPAYKDSGVEWLGEVPGHWDVNRLKFLVSSPLMYGANEAGDSDDPEHPRFIRITDVDSSGNLREDTFRSLPPDIAEQYLLQPGDVLLARSGATVGKTFIYKPEWGTACFAGYLIRASLDANRMLPQYFWYFCQSHSYWKYITALQIQATIQNVSAGKYNDLPVSFPLLSEQQSVITFLDAETAQIDALIAKQEQMIALLQEKRQALISHAVTRGLNPDAPMKESGVEWLGKIPAHWNVDLVKRHFDVALGKMLNRSTENGEGITKPYLRAANIHWHGVIVDEIGVNEMEFSPDQLQRYQLKKGDLLVTEGGVTVGRSAIFNDEVEDCYYQNSLNRVRLLSSGSVSTKYLYYWLYFTKENGYIDIVADKATFGHLTNEKLKALPLTVPSRSEQEQITLFLDQETAQIDGLIEKARTVIDRLQERRTALISAAVTGKIDVRAAMN